MRILFLTAHLQPFLCAGLNELAEVPDIELLVYTQQRSENEWLDFRSDKIRVHTYVSEPEEHFRQQVDAFRPEIIFCAGWMYPLYLSWCRRWKAKGALTICAMDTQWKASLRQRLLIVLSPILLKTACTHAWVPGPRQKEYARRLGFAEERILEGLYAADTPLFRQAFRAGTHSGAPGLFPHRLLYAGRLEPHKLRNFLIAFHRLHSEELGDWVLEIIGSGSMDEDPLLRHPAIRRRPFLGQNALVASAAEGGVFCLCSADEPWGTVIQEFAAAGMPLLVSRQCGASDLYARENAFLCDGADPEDIALALRRVLQATDTELWTMAAQSALLGCRPDSADWARSLLSVKK